jgi:hypothetical protein
MKNVFNYFPQFFDYNFYIQVIKSIKFGITLFLIFFDFPIEESLTF